MPWPNLSRMTTRPVIGRVRASGRARRRHRHRSWLDAERAGRIALLCAWRHECWVQAIIGIRTRTIARIRSISAVRRPWVVPAAWRRSSPSAVRGSVEPPTMHPAPPSGDCWRHTRGARPGSGTTPRPGSGHLFDLCPDAAMASFRWSLIRVRRYNAFCREDRQQTDDATSEADQVAALEAVVRAAHEQNPSASPAWLATAAMQSIGFRREIHPVGYWATHRLACIGVPAPGLEVKPPATLGNVEKKMSSSRRM